MIGTAKSAVEAGPFGPQAEEAEVGKIDIELRLRMAREEAGAQSRMGFTVTLDALGGALQGEAGMGERVALARSPVSNEARGSATRAVYARRGPRRMTRTVAVEAQEGRG